MIGTEIAGYRVLEKLGEGGMGVVYKAVDTSLDRVVAIKVLSPDLVRNPELVQRFRAEARAQANLNHTNLATLYAFIVQDNMACMVMEFVDGETFEKMIYRRGPIPAMEAVPLFKQVLLGMGYAHRSGIVHRDIKPSNLMVNAHGIVKVMDFGIAKVMGARSMTRTGTQMGTGWYMPPEQVLNQMVDFRSDIYSLGVTLYQMLSAHVPFEGDSDFKIMSDQVHAPPPPPTRFYPYIPRGVENAVLKALEKNPNSRFQTVEEFGQALERPEDFAYAAPVMYAPPTPTAPAPASYQQAPQTPVPAPYYQAPQTPVPAPPYSAATAAPPHAWTPPPAPPTPIPYSPPQPHYQTVAQPAQASAPSTRMLFAGKTSKIIAGATAGVLGLLLVAGLIFKVRSKPEMLPPRGPVPVDTRTPLERSLSAVPKGELMSSTTALAPKVDSFQGDSASVAPGQTVHLTWAVSGASSVTIDPGIGTVKPQGSIDIPVQKTTEFKLVASNDKGETATKSATVTVAQAEQRPVQQTRQQPPPRDVRPPPAPVKPAISFHAYPPNVVAGGFTMLAWDVSNAQTVSIEPSIGVMKQFTGQYRLSPPETTTYTLTATSPDGTVSTSELTVQVSEPPRQQAVAPVPPPVVQQQPAPARPAVAINVVHDHGGVMVQGGWPSCWGQLAVVGNHLIYQVTGSNDGRRDGFDVLISQVQEIKLNRMPIRGQQLFHITVNGQHFNFAASGMGAMQALTLLDGAIRR